MLLQISEPTTQQQNKLPAIGIDLGTTHSLAAIIQNDQCVTLTPLIPSVVGVLNEQLTVGQAVLDQPDTMRAIFSVKRLMGLSVQDVQSQSIHQHVLADQQQEPSSVPRLVLGNQQLTAVELSAEILREVKRQSELKLGHEVHQAVITVPAYFNDSQRQATKDAAKLEGLEVLRLLNEPTAAAVAYGLDQQSSGIYAVYDLGGGTFDCSIIKFNQGIFQVLATSGDTHLGGDDFDQVIMDHMINSKNQYGKLDLIALRLKARDIKHQLSQSESDLDGCLTQEKFNELINPLIDRTLKCVQQALSDAKLTVNDIAGVIMVGGSTRVPYVIDRVGKFFNQMPLTNLNPDEIVAHGAARQAYALTGGTSTLLLDVVPLSLGVELMGGLVERIIERNTAIPARYAKTFTTQQDGQSGLVLHIVQGERDKADDCRSLAHFTFHGIPPLKAGLPKIKVTFQIDADGLLTVSAYEESTQIQQSVEVNATYGLSVQDMRQMLVDSFNHAQVDLQERRIIEACLKGKGLINTVITACQQDQSLLHHNQINEIYVVIDQLESDINTRKLDEIVQGTHTLTQLTHDFADRRLAHALKNLT